ncbi:MAG: hypothetical protein ACE5MI_14425 [Acidimicrobiia bacterium]
MEITGRLTRSAAEALELEIRRLAKRYGAEVKVLRIERRSEDA